MVDRRTVFADVVFEEEALEGGLDRGDEPGVVAHDDHAVGAVGVEDFAGGFVADGVSVVFSLNGPVGGVRGGGVVDRPVKEDPVDPTAGKGGEGIGLAKGDEDDFVRDGVMTLMEQVRGVAMDAVIPVEGTDDDVDRVGALYQCPEGVGSVVEKEGEDGFGEENGGIALVDRLIDALECVIDMRGDLVPVPLVCDGGMRGDELERMGGISRKPLDVNGRVGEKGEEEKQGSSSPKGDDDRPEHQCKLPLCDPEIAVDEDQLRLEPIKTKRMEVADTQQQEASKYQGEG